MTDHAPDYGATGPAARARQSRIVSVATGSTAIGAEKTEARRYADAHLIDRLHLCGQLWDRLYAAATKVAELHGDSGLEPAQSGSYAPRGWTHGHDTDEDDAHTPMEEFRRLLGGCSVAHANILHAMCLGQHPGVCRLATLQAALGDLADRWGMK